MLYEFRGVTLEHPAAGVTVVRDFDLVVEQRELLVLSGPSGSGKTTVLNAMAGFVKPTTGRVSFQGRDVASMDAAAKAAYRNADIGMVHQSFNLISDLDAVQNVMIPLLIRGNDSRAAREEATDFLIRLGLGHRAGHRPSEMSGGEQQRVAICRALVGGPSVLLADEPTGNLDSAATADFLALLTELHSTENLTVVLVTHDPMVAAVGTRRVRFGNDAGAVSSRDA